MQIICISKGSQSRGEEFAKSLAAKLDYECLGREYLLEEATKRRISIGKLETAIIKPHLLTDKLSLELKHYKVLATSILCQKALNGNIVYHGRTGHLLLPGISHILKLRVVADMEYRLSSIMKRMQMSREKAKLYIEQIDEDRRKWVKQFYNTEWEIFGLYDFVINLSYVNVDNAATAVCHIAQLPEFQSTPSTINALKDLYLASRAQLLLFQDRRTHNFNVNIKANNGMLNVTYPIYLAEKIDTINEILSRLEDLKEIVYTKAQTNLLWIQEKFDENDSSYDKVLSIANNWDAAVELLKFVPDEEQELVLEREENIEPTSETWRQTGIIADGEEVSSDFSKDMLKIYEKLITDNRAGGRRTIIGSRKTLLNSIDKSSKYKLILLDNIFLSKGEAARKRSIREWSNALSDLIFTPVITLDELEIKYKFGTKHIFQLFINSFIILTIIFLIFKFDQNIIDFLSVSNSNMRILATICILIFVPFFAHFFSKAIGLILKLIKFE